MKTAKNKPYHHGDLGPALVRASTDIIQESGASALSLRAVARRLGVSHAAPGHHFADKRALFAAVAARGFGELEQAMRAATEKAGSQPLARLEASGVAYVRFAAENPELFRLMVGRELYASDSLELKHAADTAFQVLVNEARSSLGDASEERLRLVTISAWSLVHGLAMLWLDGRLKRAAATPDALEEIAREVTALVGKAVSSS
jgi:AcrR family transcriptional regulator